MWSGIFREKHRLRLFKNRRLAKTFGFKRKKERAKWRKICNERLNYSYSS
jgi:hypothetical protein